MITLKLEDREILATVERLRAVGADLKPAFQEIGEYLLDSTKRRFASGTAPDGTPWAPNSDATLVAMLRARGGLSQRKTATGGRTLTRKGIGLIGAKKPLIGESRRLSGEIHVRADATSVTVGSALEYAAVHQIGAQRGAFGRTRRGSPIPWGDIPARPFLGLSDQDRATVLAILREHLESAMGR